MNLDLYRRGWSNMRLSAPFFCLAAAALTFASGCSEPLPRDDATLAAVDTVTPIGARPIESDDVDPLRTALGARLFAENRLGNPGSQYTSSCRSCHQPPDSTEGPRAYADRIPRSLIPSTSDNMKTTTNWNTPTLLDVARGDRFNWDGSGESLESVLREKITGRHYGWLETDLEQALDEIYSLILLDTGDTPGVFGTYLEEFEAAYGVDLSAADRSTVVEAVVGGLADYVRTLRAPRNAPFDEFVRLNSLDDADHPAYAGQGVNFRALEAQGPLAYPDGFSDAAYQGMKIFFRMYPEPGVSGGVGACVICHHPPTFSDYELHVVGVGEGEGEKSLAIKTATLRNLALTDPFMHDGELPTLESVIRQKMVVAQKAHDDTALAVDPSVRFARLTEDDIALLVAFLESLNENLTDVPAVAQ